MALRDINLIPPDIALNRLVKHHLVFWAGCLIVSICFILGLYLIYGYVIKVQSQSLTKNQGIPGQLAAKIEELKRLQGDQERLNQQRAALAAIKSKSPPVSLAISKLSEIMNDETWLSQLVIDPGEEQEKESRLVLTGFSMSNEHLGNFLNRLSVERPFKTVVLKFASESEKEEPGQKTAGSKGKIKFQITCQIGKG